MRTAFEVKVILAALIMTVIILLAGHSSQRHGIDQLQEQVKALEFENAGQWERISELEIMLCNPELIKCGK